MKRYRVLGTKSYLGHAPGTEFAETLDPDAERRALARGSVEVVGEEKTIAEERESELDEPADEEAEE